MLVIVRVIMIWLNMCWFSCFVSCRLVSVLIIMSGVRMVLVSSIGFVNRLILVRNGILIMLMIVKNYVDVLRNICIGVWVVRKYIDIIGLLVFVIMVVNLLSVL